MLKGERTRQRIIAKAAPLFNRRGYDGCSMQDISAATGLEKGSLYSHFATKEELAVAAFDHAWAQTCSARVGNLDQAPNSVDKLKLHIANFVSKPSFPGGCPMLNTVLDADDGNATLRRRAEGAMRDWVGFLADITRAGQAKGEIRSTAEPGRTRNSYHLAPGRRLRQLQAPAIARRSRSGATASGKLSRKPGASERLTEPRG